MSKLKHMLYILRSKCVSDSDNIGRKISVDFSTRTNSLLIALANTKHQNFCLLYQERISYASKNLIRLVILNF